MYTFDGRIRFSEVDRDGRLTFAALLNYFQDCSTFQSEDIGLGVNYLKERNMVWVLSSWQIVVDKYPELCERVKIGTIPYAFKGFVGYRNFAMTDMEGNYYAVANTLWSLLDLRTGKPAIPPQDMKDGYVLEERLPMDYAPRKIVVPEGGESCDTIVVKKHHLDTNGHVNNGQYVALAIEFLPEGFEIRQMRAEYKRQAFLDDVFYPYVAKDNGRYIISLMDDSGKPYVVVEFTGRED
ncbi:MAG: thioesterase [Lachnospiraceae bacterium]|nr:thioesterase [Lachnospiraceae bacterium]